MRYNFKVGDILKTKQHIRKAYGIIEVKVIHQKYGRLSDKDRELTGSMYCGKGYVVAEIIKRDDFKVSNNYDDVKYINWCKYNFTKVKNLDDLKIDKQFRCIRRGEPHVRI